MKESIIESTLPAEFGLTLLIFSLILTLAPWLSGADFGIFKIPQVSLRARNVLRIVGPICLVAAIAIHLPLLPLLEPKKKLVDTEPLCAIERGLVLRIEGGNARFTSLLAYYENENPELFQHLQSVLQRYDSKIRHRGATYVMGPPGVGKSFVARELDGFTGPSCAVRFGDLERMADDDLKVVRRPDLASLDQKLVFNDLPSLDIQDPSALQKVLVRGGCQRDGRLVPLLILDDLDEIHPESSNAVLRSIEQTLVDGPHQPLFLHFVVFGRPESFGFWLRDPARVPPRNVNVSRFVLLGPKFLTTGDLRFLGENYYEFKDLGEPTENQLHRFVTLVTGLPSLSYSIRNLAVANFAIEQSRVNPSVAEESVKRQIYDNLLDRNHRKNDRPARHLGVYGKILERIAAKYADRVDDQGFFLVRFEDKVSAEVDERNSITVRVRDVLDRSGIAFLDPVVFTNTRYRFDPFWVHGFLVERYNQRIDPERKYRGCS